VSYSLALSDDFSYVTYTTDCSLGGPDSRVIRNSNPDHRSPRTAPFAEKLLYLPLQPPFFDVVHWVLPIDNAVLSLRREVSISSTS
jgi:hypothetical protein